MASSAAELVSSAMTVAPWAAMLQATPATR